MSNPKLSGLKIFRKFHVTIFNFLTLTLHTKLGERETTKKIHILNMRARGRWNAMRSWGFLCWGGQSIKAPIMPGQIWLESCARSSSKYFRFSQMPHLFYGMEIVMDRKSIKIKTFQFSLSQIYTIGIFTWRKSAKCSEIG